MAHALSSLIDRLATPVSRRTGITATLLAIAAGLAGTAETDAKKKKKKKKLGQPCVLVTDCANAQDWQCAPYANSKISSSTGTFCLLHDGDQCNQNNACPYGFCQDGQCASASVVATTNGAYSTIAEAVAGTYAGGEICFMPGTYNDVSVSIDKTLTIRSCLDSGQVVLNSPNNGRVFTLQLANAEDVVTIRGTTMDSFTMSGIAVTTQEDRVDDGGIIDLSLPGTGATAAGSLVLEYLTLTKGRARVSGGGLRAHTSGTVTLKDVMVRECVSPKGGGIAMKRGALTLKGQSWVKSCVASLRGAGVLLVEGTTTLSMEDTARIGADYAGANGPACLQAGGNWGDYGLGGGIYAETGTSVTMANDATVFCNVAVNGGGILVDTDASLSGAATCQSGKVAGNFDNVGESNIETPITTSC